MKFISFIFIVLITLPAQASTKEYHYQISADDVALGVMIERREQKPDGSISITRNTDLRARFGLWNFEYHLRSQLEYRDGRLQQLNHRVNDDGTLLWIQGSWQSGAFRLQTKEIQNLEEQENSELVKGTLGLASMAVPYLDLALALFSQDSEDSDLILETTQFDGFFDELLFSWSRLEKGTQHWKLLNSETQTLVDVEIMSGANGLFELKSGGPAIPYRELILQVADYEHRYWLAEGIHGDYLLRLQGRDSDGPFLVEWLPSPRITQAQQQ